MAKFSRAYKNCLFSARTFIFIVGFFSFAHSYKVTLDALLTGAFRPTYFDGTWISDTEFSYVSGTHVMVFNAAVNSSGILINGDQFSQQNFPGRTLQRSGDEKFILVTHTARTIMEIFPRAKYHLYNNVTREIYPLNPPGHSDPVNQAELELVLWSPSTSSNALAYVYDHNVYYQAEAAQGTVAQQITFDGNVSLSNGRVTWVFADDIFGTGNTMGFSPDGFQLAFVKFDETPVPEFKFMKYGEPNDHTDFQYPEVQSIRFPKAGSPNGIQSLHVVNLTDPNLRPFPLTYPLNIDPAELHYIATAHWRTPKDLVVVWLNRKQLRSHWFTCDVSTPLQPCRFIWSEYEPQGWINMNPVHVSSDGNSLITLSNALTPEAAKSYRHVIKLTLSPTGNATEEHWNPITYDFAAVHLDEILGWNETTNVIHFMGNTAIDPSESQIFSVWRDSQGVFAVTCLTCALKDSQGENCKSNMAIFSLVGHSHFFHQCLGPGVPEFVMRRTADGTVVQVMEANSALRELLADAELPTQKNYYDIPLASGFKARARLYLPPGFNENHKYPLVVEVYAGPETQFNQYGFDMSWETSLTSDKNVVYARIDGSGSSRQSMNQFFRLKNRLGTIEVEDQIEATSWLIQNTSFIDPNRTAIWGWSNGGYVASMVLAKDLQAVFKCGIAKAPASSWFYTASITTERHMGLPTPDDNLRNYLAGDIPSLVEGFRGKEYLLIHGTADINANYQHSMKLMRALEQAGILFTAISYPDELHAISSAGMYSHQYHTFERFLFRDCFGGSTVEPEPIPTTTTTTTTNPSNGAFKFQSSNLGFLVILVLMLKRTGFP